MITNTEFGTNIEEIAEGVYRINTPMPPHIIPGGFSYNQYLIVDDESVLFHTGPRKMFGLIREAIETVLPVSELRFIGLSHVESDECGSLNEFLAVAPTAQPLCGRIAAMISINDMADRQPRVLANDEALPIGRHVLRWFDTPHLPHGWEAGYLFEEHTSTLLCGDLFTQPGMGEKAIVETDIFESSEAFRKKVDYYSHSRNAGDLIRKLADTKAKNLACMHGSAWTGDGETLLLRLATVL